MKRTFAFVETLSGIAAARESGVEWIGTDNPLLAHDPRAGGDIIDVSEHLDQPEASELGRAAIDVLLELDRVLEREKAAERYGARSGPLNLTMPLRALASTLVQRGLMLKRALAVAGGGNLLLAVPDHPRWHNSSPWNMPRFACPHRSLGEAGFFGERSVAFKPVVFSPPAEFNDTSTDDILLRTLLAQPSQVAFEVAKRLSLVRPAGISRIAVGKGSEVISETLPWLAAQGIRFGVFKLPPYLAQDPPSFGNPPVVDCWVGGQVVPTLVAGLTATGVFDEPETQAIATVIAQHVSFGMAALEKTVEAIGKALDASFAEAPAPRILLTSGAYGPMGTQLHALCKEREIHLVDFEHGATTGIAGSVERRLQVSEAGTCDMLMVSSPRAARSFSRTPKKRGRIEIVGLADQSRRILARPLQRARARRRVRLGSGEIAVMHVSTLLYGGNMRPGDDTPVERYVFATERALLTEVYPAIPKMVLYKPYPAQRFPHDTEYSELFTLAPNIRLIAREDFRYVRAAADIVVTQANSSTLGWCLGANVPLIHLGSRFVHALLDDELREQFARGLFTIDMDRKDWRECLKAMLGRDIDDLRAEWQSKSDARKALLTDGIFGPPGSVGRRAAGIIAKIHA